MSLDVYLTNPPCPHCGLRKEGYSTNITHNLGRMAEEAGIYTVCWQPEELGYAKAGQLIEPLRKGLALLKESRLSFETFNSVNGWGTYDDLVPWVEELLDACEMMPDADISVSR